VINFEDQVWAVGVAKTLTRKTQTNMAKYGSYENQCCSVGVDGVGEGEGEGVIDLQSIYFDTERNVCDYNEIVKSEKPRNFGGQTDWVEMGDGEAQTM
jgi:hypothetical protein